MAKQLSFFSNQQGDPPISDCLRYEEIQDLWRTAIPSDDEIEWCAEHVMHCTIDAHALRRPDVNPSTVLSRLDALSEVDESGAGDCRTDDEEAAPKVEDGLAQQTYDVLEHAGAIERGQYDYLLPCGQHSDTHVNAARLCWSEVVLARVAALIGRLLRDLEFDTLVSTCWPMATIARRLLRTIPRRVDHVLVEGYPPTFLGAIHPGSQVVILTDVVVSGRLTRAIQAEVRRRDGRVTRCVALAMREASDVAVGNVTALCLIPMKIEEPGSCPRCNTLPLKEFNPLASHMTLRKKRPRSPMQFLSEERDAAEFWQLVDRTGAYERHHRDGRRHYVAFVDALKLLSGPDAGGLLVGRLCTLILERTAVPDVVLAPNRVRARLVAEKLIEALKVSASGVQPELVLTRSRGGKRALPEGRRLDMRNVLVVDAAADHGDTLDELAFLASEAGASQIGAAVLLSRLRAGSEEALNARLGGGFARLFSLPIPGFRSRCIVCDRYESWREKTFHLPPGPARDLILRLTQRSGHRGRKLASTGSQLEIFAGDLLTPEQLLTTCHRRVAGGIALHALHAAQGDGMAPLSVAEVFDPRIPLNNRIGLIEALPTGVLEGPGRNAEQELETYLRTGQEPRLWLGIADVFVRAGRSEWIDGLGHALRRQAWWLSQESFWARLGAVSLQGRDVFRPEASGRLEALIDEFAATPAGDRLRELRAIVQL